MFEINSELLQSIKDTLDSISDSLFPEPNIQYVCNGCTGRCKQNCVGECRGSCKNTCTRSCKGNSR